MKRQDNYKKNFIWNTIGVFTFSLTSLLYTIILTRFSNLKFAGIFSFGFSLACTTTALASLGGRTYQVTDINNELHPFTYIFSRYLTVALTFLLVVIYIFLRDYTIYKTIVVICLCIFKYIEEISDVYYGIMQKNDKLYYVGIIQFIKSILNVIVFYISVKLFNNLMISVLSILIVNFLFILFIERPIAKKLTNWCKYYNKNQIKKYFKVNTVICLFTFLTMYIASSPKYVIDVFFADDVQAIFSILIMPAVVMQLVCNFIINPILVKLSELYNLKDLHMISILFKRIVIIIFIIGILGLCVTYFFGIPFLNIIYSLKFDNYKLELLLIICGSIFYSLSMICSSFLTAIRKINIQLIVNSIVGIVAFFISLFLVREFSIMGGAISYLIVMIVRMVIYYIVVILAFKKLKIIKE